MVNATSDQVKAAMGEVTDRDDAPIIAAAKAAGVDVLLSFDRKHLHTRAVERFIDAPVLLPAAVLKKLKTEA